MSPVDADAVLELAHARGHDWVDAAAAARIAAGASAAIAAVRATAGAVTPDPGVADEAAFRATLEALAGPAA